ncbi:TPA: biotin transporter BioY [Clostridioides difficile]|nr:biotin transporter BioY [Clostridioides difficile]
MKNTKVNIQDLTKMSICVALLCISSYIYIPLPFTPAGVTAQTIMINLIALILTPRQAFSTVGVYIMIGLIGIPVFGGGTSGIGKLLSPTGGFYIGFLFAALIISLLKGRNNDIKRYILITIFVGMPIIYFMGTVFMCYFNQMTVEAALFAAVVPFLIGDTIKSVIASFLGTKLNNVLRRNL